MSVLFGYSENYTAWLLIRFVGGLGLHWVLTEAWLANIVSDNCKKRVMAIYAATISVGFAAGPGILDGWLFHTHALLPDYCVSTACCLAYSKTSRT